MFMIKYMRSKKMSRTDNRLVTFNLKKNTLSLNP